MLNVDPTTTTVTNANFKGKGPAPKLSEVLKGREIVKLKPDDKNIITYDRLVKKQPIEELKGKLFDNADKKIDINV